MKFFKCLFQMLQMLTGGLYSKPELRPKQAYRFQRWNSLYFLTKKHPCFWMKSCIFCELIKKEFGDHRIFNTWCGDPGKVCHCYFWWWACWLFCCWAFYWKWCMERKNIDLIAFFKGSSTWCRSWDHRKGKPVSGNPGCRRYLAERFQQ